MRYVDRLQRERATRRKVALCAVAATLVLPAQSSPASIEDSLHTASAPLDDQFARTTEDGVGGDTRDSLRFSRSRFYIVNGTILAGMAGIRIYQANGWWQGNRRSFHFKEDIHYAAHVDKIAHFWSAALLSQVLYTGYRWTGMEEGRARLWGAAGAALFSTYVEVEDGFSTWGFDRLDFAGDVFGAFWPVARYYLPYLANFDLKWMYLPSQNLHKPGDFPGQKHLIFDDYEGYSFWLSFKVNNLLPDAWEPYWPDFLCLAAGYRARDILDPSLRRGEFMIGLDLDMTKVIPDDTWFLRSLGESLNYLRFPLPAVRVSRGAVWYGIYF